MNAIRKMRLAATTVICGGAILLGDFLSPPVALATTCSPVLDSCIEFRVCALLSPAQRLAACKAGIPAGCTTVTEATCFVQDSSCPAGGLRCFYK